MTTLSKVEELVGLLHVRYCKEHRYAPCATDSITKRIMWGLSQLEEGGCPWNEIEEAMWFLCSIVGNYDQVWNFVFGGHLGR
jgi:hypothetical protein